MTPILWFIGIVVFIMGLCLAFCFGYAVGIRDWMKALQKELTDTRNESEGGGK